MADGPRSMFHSKITFVGSLGVTISLFYFSVLRQHQLTALDYSILVSLTLMALVFDYLKTSQFLSAYKTHAKALIPHESAIRLALSTTLKSRFLLRLLETELLTLYYAFLAKFETNNLFYNDTTFGYTDSSHARDVYLFVALSQLPFLPFIHIFLEFKKGPGLAWAITLLTVWSVIWYLAQVEAVKFRRIRLGKRYLRYRFGLMWKADIPLDNILSVRLIDVAEPLKDKDLFLSPLGSTKNVLLEFKDLILFSGAYGLNKRKTKAAISLDNPAYFLSQLELRGISIAK